MFTHEYAHICHLDRSRGWARAAKAIFGRTVLAFPNLSLPLWQIEGLATLVESEEGAGRLHSGDFKEVVAAGVRADRFEPIDRVNGGLVDWPNGDGWYSYGALFHEFLVERYGRDRLETLAGRTAGRLPYFTSGAFRDVYGKIARRLLARVQRLESRRFRRRSRRFRRRASPALDLRPHAARRPRRFSVVQRIGSARFPGSIACRRIPGPERLPRAYGGSGLTFARDVAVFDSTRDSFVAPGCRATYMLSVMNSRGVRRLTRHARLVDPDFSADGRLLVAVQVQSGSRQLVVLDAQSLLASRTPVAAKSLRFLASLGDEADVFAAPRFSPDGRHLAVERRRRGGPSEIVIVDAALQDSRVVATSPTGRNVAPEWSADGTALIFASDCDGGPFELYETSSLDRVQEPQRVLRVTGGARSPALAPDGRVVFVGYTAQGFDLFESRIAMHGDTGGARPHGGFDTAVATPLGRIAMRVDTDGATPSGRVAMRFDDKYRPWPTLLPHGWLPLIDRRDGRWRLGAVVTGYDVLGRHVIAADATWAVNDGDVGGGLAPRSRPDWSASDVYQRWQIAPFVSVRDRTSLFNAATTEGSVVPVAQREQQVDAGIYRAFRRIRWTQTVTGMFHAERVSTAAPALEQDVDRSVSERHGRSYRAPVPRP